jgi:hypothetical protein
VKESENNIGKALQEGEEGDFSIEGALHGAPYPIAIWNGAPTHSMPKLKFTICVKHKVAIHL